MFARLFAFGLILLALCPARAQDVDDPEIVVNIDVGYNTAFRDGSWVPIDVTVDNSHADLEGWVEVVTYNALGDRQSPVYQMPVVCPQNSRKRFRLYGYLENTSEIQAAVYNENGRLAVDAPAYLEPRPIDNDDLIAIVLDDEPLDYTFLLDAVALFPVKRRLTRWNLGTATLDSLPERLQCYDAIDALIIGRVDATRFTPDQRRIIEDYVKAGGTLAVLTGAHAASFRDSWLEPLIGSQIGSARTLAESQLQAELFGDAGGMSDDRMLTLATLTPDEGSESAGSGPVLATRRELGAGRVYTIAVDAASHALHRDTHYHELWNEILSGRIESGGPPSLAQFDSAFINSLPQVSGVSIRPAEHVLIYLALYIGLGIVANWLFWSRVGRREFAWVTLLFVSTAFTAYAVVSGTGGMRARKVEHQATVYQLKQGAAVTRAHRVTGLLSSQSAKMRFTMSSPLTLAREAGFAAVNNRWGIQQFGIARPFVFHQGDPPQIEDFRVGANDVRGFSESYFAEFGGDISGQVSLGRDAGINAQIVNRTGLEFSDVVLFARGRFYPLEPKPGGTELTLAPNADPGPNGPFERYARYGGAYYFYGSDWDEFSRYLMVSTTMLEDSQEPDPYADPMFIGRLRSDHATGSRETGRIEEYVVAPLPLNQSDHERVVLAQYQNGYLQAASLRPYENGNWQGTVANWPISIAYRVPESLEPADGSDRLLIDIHYSSTGRHTLSLRPNRAGGDTAAWSAVEDKPLPGNPSVRVKRYTIPNWQDWVSPERELPVQIAAEPAQRTEAPRGREAPSPGGANVQYHIRATLEIETPQASSEEWPVWQ